MANPIESGQTQHQEGRFKRLISRVIGRQTDIPSARPERTQSNFVQGSLPRTPEGRVLYPRDASIDTTTFANTLPPEERERFLGRSGIQQPVETPPQLPINPVEASPTRRIPPPRDASIDTTTFANTLPQADRERFMAGGEGTVPSGNYRDINDLSEADINAAMDEIERNLAARHARKNPQQ